MVYVSEFPTLGFGPTVVLRAYQCNPKMRFSLRLEVGKR